MLVGVNQDPHCPAMVRYARRLADRVHAPWTAIHIETSRTQRLTWEERDRIANCLRLAEGPGGDALTVPGASVAEGMVEYTRSNNFIHLVIAKSRRPRWSEWLRGSVMHQLIRQADDISVHVIAERIAGSGAERSGSEAEKPLAVVPGPRHFADPKAYLGSAGLVAVALGSASRCSSSSGSPTSRSSFLTAVMTSALAYGLLP